MSTAIIVTISLLSAVALIGIIYIVVLAVEFVLAIGAIVHTGNGEFAPGPPWVRTGALTF